MKKISFLKKIDSAGRLTIPCEIRQAFGYNKEMVIEVIVEKNQITLKKTQYLSCTICGQVVEKSDTYCRNCGEKL